MSSTDPEKEIPVSESRANVSSPKQHSTEQIAKSDKPMNEFVAKSNLIRANSASLTPESHPGLERKDEHLCSKSRDNTSQKATGRKLRGILKYQRHQSSIRKPDKDSELFEEIVLSSNAPEIVFSPCSMDASTLMERKEMIADIRAKWQFFQVFFVMLHGITLSIMVLQYFVFDNDELLKRLEN